MNTLKGVFPEPKPAPKRNFLKENMQNIKQMQGLVQTIRGNYPQHGRHHGSLYRRNATSRLGFRQHKTTSQRFTAVENQKAIPLEPIDPMSRKYETVNACCRTAMESMKNAMKDKTKGKDIGIQTEVISKKLFENATIKYPTQAQEIMSIQTKQKSQIIDRRIRQEESSRQNILDIGSGEKKQKDFVKENAQVVFANRKDKEKPHAPPGNAPLNYKKGVVPKYIKDRKEELYRQAKSTEGDEKCPEGHVMLPENERKETLRMLRQSYAELITELNMMPVRSDTLKIRNRKIELENQLKKLDEGIKVFTRPKVYVKIGA